MPIGPNLNASPASMMQETYLPRLPTTTGSGCTSRSDRTGRSIRSAGRTLFATAVLPLPRAEPFGLAAGLALRAATRAFGFSVATAAPLRPRLDFALADGFRIL